MKQLIYRLTEPAETIPEERKIFSDHDLKVLILPLFLVADMCYDLSKISRKAPEDMKLWNVYLYCATGIV